ncbi:MAG: response regulator [Elusimicrobia bacterium]|nr:response regulator [Elusimicrobiota bacterium]
MRKPSIKNNKKETVLVIDDEADMDWMMTKILRNAGYQVVTARTGAEGIAKFQRTSPRIHFMVLDMRLPDRNGLEVLKQIKTMAPRTEVLMVTAFGTPECRKRAKALGALELLDKPFRVEKVLKAARLAFDRKERR